MDFSNIIVTIDYLIRKVMAMLDDLAKKFGISLETTTVEETTTETTETTTVAG